MNPNPTTNARAKTAKWSPERREAFRRRLKEIPWTPERRKLSGDKLRQHRLQSRLANQLGGKTGWTPERRAAQAERMRAVGYANAGEKGRMVRAEREAKKRRRQVQSAKARASWTPERRRQQAERLVGLYRFRPTFARRSKENLQVWHAQQANGGGQSQ